MLRCVCICTAYGDKSASSEPVDVMYTQEHPCSWAPSQQDTQDCSAASLGPRLRGVASCGLLYSERHTLWVTVSPPRSVSLGTSGLNGKTCLNRRMQEVNVVVTHRGAVGRLCPRQPAPLPRVGQPRPDCSFPFLWPLLPLSPLSALCHSQVSDIDVLDAALLIPAPSTPDGPCVQDLENVRLLSPSLHREQTRIQEQSTPEWTLCLPFPRLVQTLREPHPNTLPPFLGTLSPLEYPLQ